MARVRYGSNGRLNVPMVIRTPQGGGVRGALYHSQSVEAYFYHTPGLKVVNPATPYDAKGLLKSAIRDDDPVIFLEHKRTYRLVRGEVPEEEYTIPIGKADVKLEGQDMSIITYGLMVHHCLEAAHELAQEGINAEVIDLLSISPIDYDHVIDSVRRTHRLVVVDEDTPICSMASEICSRVAEEAFDYLDAPPSRVTAPHTPVPYSRALESNYMPNEARVISTVQKLFNR